MPYCYHDRLASLCLVHPSLTVRAALFVLSYLPRVSFWDKLNYCDRLEFLDDAVPVSLIKMMPQRYKDYDKALDKEMYEASSKLGAGASMGGMGSGMGGLPDGMGMGLGGMGMPSMPGSTAEGEAAAGDGDEAPQAPLELPKRNWEMD